MAGKRENAISVFRKNYGKLTSGLQNHLTLLVAHLYSTHLVSLDTKGRILDNNSTASTCDRCTWLLNDVEDRIRSDYSSLEKFCEVLCCPDIDLTDLGEPMLCDFQQLCENSKRSTFHGSYSTPAMISAEPVENEDSCAVQPLRSGCDMHKNPGDVENSRSLVKSFTVPQQELDDSTDNIHVGGTTCQVVPVTESSLPGRVTSLPAYDDFTGAQGRSVPDHQEKMLYDDMVSTCYIALQQCKDCAKVRAECEAKISKMKKYYESCSANASSTFELEEDKKALSKVLEIKMEEKRAQLKESKEKILNLQFQVDELQGQVDDLQYQINELQATKNEHEQLVTSKTKELHNINQFAKLCPVYSDEKKLDSFKQKKQRCDTIQSLTKQYFTTHDPHTKSKLKGNIQDEFTHFASPGRDRCSSL